MDYIGRCIIYRDKKAGRANARLLVPINVEKILWNKAALKRNNKKIKKMKKSVDRTHIGC
ncbi:MAG: hypothetical protein E7254_08635 [Lachnospiraceae bacterium]|nr:hypothetical protein [Lachnospiraceae bacterium]